MEIKETGREMQRERKRETYKERVTITRFPRPRDNLSFGTIATPRAECTRG